MHAPELRGRLEARCADAALSHMVEIPVLGIRTAFRTNSPAVMQVIEEAFGAWKRLEPGDIDRGAPATVRIVVHDGAGEPPGEIVHEQAAGGRLLIRAHACGGISDPVRRDAAAYVSDALLADRAGFRYGMLEALTWALLTRFDRQPFHAAGLAADDAVLLLAGGSGTGKSTLAYAAARAGMDVLTDDIVFLQSTPRIRAWGARGPIRLLPEAAAHFAELAGLPPVRMYNGRMKVVAPLPASRAPAAYDRCLICILGERRSRAEARRLTSAQLLAAMDPAAESGFSVFADTIEPVFRVLAGRGGWLLHPAAAPAASLPLLREMLAGLAPAVTT